MKNKGIGLAVNEEKERRFDGEEVRNGLHCLAGKAMRILVKTYPGSDARQGAQAVLLGLQGFKCSLVIGSVISPVGCHPAVLPWIRNPSRIVK
jgi:hypothetical protein